MNSSDLTNDTSVATAATAVVCRIWKEEYHLENYVSTLVAIILNIVTCPLTICMNLLVIVAVKTKPRLQTVYNFLLCALAATDMVVGAVIQPIYAVDEMSLLTGSSLTEYCTQYHKTVLLVLTPSLASCIAIAGTAKHGALFGNEIFLTIHRYHNQGSGSYCCYYLLGHRSSSSSFPIYFFTPRTVYYDSCFHKECQLCSDCVLSHFCLLGHPSSHNSNQI